MTMMMMMENREKKNVRKKIDWKERIIILISGIAREREREKDSGCKVEKSTRVNISSKIKFKSLHHHHHDQNCLQLEKNGWCLSMSYDSLFHFFIKKKIIHTHTRSWASWEKKNANQQSQHRHHHHFRISHH